MSYLVAVEGIREERGLGYKAMEKNGEELWYNKEEKGISMGEK